MPCDGCLKYNNAGCAYTTPVLKRGPKPHRGRAAIQPNSEFTSPYVEAGSSIPLGLVPASEPAWVSYWPIAGDKVSLPKLQYFLECCTYQPLPPRLASAVIKYFTFLDSDMLALDTFLSCLTMPFTENATAILDHMAVLARLIDISPPATYSAMESAYLYCCSILHMYLLNDPLDLPRFVMERAIAALDPLLN